MTPRRTEDDSVPRPLKRAEYKISHVSQQAARGWQDVTATYRNAVVDAWTYLSTRPTDEDGQNVYRLKSGLGTGTHEGQTFDRYQYKLPNGARIWYFVDTYSAKDAKTHKVAGRVLIEIVHTAHPNETK